MLTISFLEENFFLSQSYASDLLGIALIVFSLDMFSWFYFSSGCYDIPSFLVALNHLNFTYDRN